MTENKKSAIDAILFQVQILDSERGVVVHLAESEARWLRSKVHRLFESRDIFVEDIKEVTTFSNVLWGSIAHLNGLNEGMKRLSKALQELGSSLPDNIQEVVTVSMKEL